MSPSEVAQLLIKQLRFVTAIQNAFINFPSTTIKKDKIRVHNEMNTKLFTLFTSDI
jgi:hypothetical protein